MIQGSQEWLQARLGHATASRISDVVARTKSGPAASRANYAAELIAERLTGVPVDKYTNAAMQWGTATEPDARAAYAFYADAEVTEVGFIKHPAIAWAGCSPDGLVGENGLVEIKCPNTATHLETLLGAEIDGKYIKQMQFQMAVTERDWCDWVSFDPRLPEAMRLFVKRVNRDDVMIAELEKETAIFLAEIEQKVNLLRERYGQREAA